MEFLENRRSWENQKPRQNRQKSGLFWASPCLNAPSLDTDKMEVQDISCESLLHQMSLLALRHFVWVREIQMSTHSVRKAWCLPAPCALGWVLFCPTFRSVKNSCVFFSSGKTDLVQFKGFLLNRALSAYKNGLFASTFCLSGIGVLEASKKASLSFKSPSPKPQRWGKTTPKLGV